MTTRKLILIISAALLLPLASCHTASKAVGGGNTGTTSYDNTTKAEPSNISALASTYKSWKTFSSGGRMEIGGDVDFGTSMQIHIVKGKSIFISLRPVFGIEMGRLYITNDSVIAIDKYHKRYMAESLSFITNGVPITIDALQDIFLNRAFILGEGTLTPSMKNKVDVKASSIGSYSISPKKQYNGFTYGFNVNSTNHITSLNVSPTGEKSTYTVNYDNFNSTSLGTMATMLSIATKIGGKDFTLSFDYSKITWNSNFNDEIKIAPGYTRISGKSLMSSISDL